MKQPPLSVCILHGMQTRGCRVDAGWEDRVLTTSRATSSALSSNGDLCSPRMSSMAVGWRPPTPSCAKIGLDLLMGIGKALPFTGVSRRCSSSINATCHDTPNL